MLPPYLKGGAQGVFLYTEGSDPFTLQGEGRPVMNAGLAYTVKHIQKGLTLLPYALGMYELYHVEALEMPLPTLTAGCPAALGRCDLQKAGPVLSSWLNAFLIECLARK